MNNQSQINREHIRNHKVKVENKYFFDTNIWIFLYGNNPIDYGFQNKRQDYEHFFQKLLTTKSEIFIDRLIISEFVNRYISRCLEQYRSDTVDKNLSKKNYRLTDDYRSNVEDVTNCIKKILSVSHNIKHIESSIDDVIDLFSKFPSDINDLFIEDICLSKDLFLVTDDSDFSFSSAKIISNNHHLIR